jgi:hypothetical protein
VGSEQKKEENRLVKRAGRRREQGREASNSIQRTEKKASRSNQRTALSSEQRG